MYGAFFQYIKDLFFFAAYVSNHHSFPEPLSPAEEQECLLSYEQGNEEARAKLIEHNLRLVAHIAKKYTATGRENDDIISIGTIGLIKAVSTYNTQKGTALATYAARCIENEILMSLRAEKKQSGEVSLNEPVGKDREGNEISLAEVLGSDPSLVQDEVELHLAAERLRKTMDRVLTEREKIVIQLRYGLLGDHCMAQREIADMMDISRSYVSRIEKKALIKLSKALQD